MSISIEKYRQEHGDEGGGLCPHCLAPVGRFDHFCPKCARPITAHAATDPFGQVLSAGAVYRGAVDSAPRFVIVLGMWLIFAPGVVVASLMTLGAIGSLIRWLTEPVGRGHAHGGAIEVTQVVTGADLMTVGAPLLGMVVVLLQVVILWKVTRRYLAARPAAEVEDPELEDDLLAKEALSYLSEEETSAIERVESPEPKRLDPVIALGLIVLIVGLLSLTIAMIGPEFFPAG